MITLLIFNLAWAEPQPEGGYMGGGGGGDGAGTLNIPNVFLLIGGIFIFLKIY